MTTQPSTPSELLRRFWSNVDKNGPVPPHRPELGQCWVWIASFNRKGYGQFQNGSSLKAHRVSWEITNGKIEGKLQVLHKCDNPACVNPAHLFLGTHQDNVKDKVEKGRQANGESNGMAKLTEGDVFRIRQMLNDGMGQSEISRMFPVSHTIIWKIKNGKLWKQKTGSD